MSTTLLFWKDDFGETSIRCDALIGLKDERAAEYTEHPIEDGSSIVDHRVIRPDRLTLEIVHSNEPIEAEDGFSLKKLDLDVEPDRFKPQGLLLIHSAVGGAIGAILGGARKPLKAAALQPTKAKNRILELHDLLIAAHQAGAECTVVQLGRVYEGMGIVSVLYSREGNGRGGRASFTLEFKQIRKAKIGLAELPDPADLHAKGETSRGKKPSDELKQAEKDAVLDKSLLAMSLDSVGAALAP